MLKISKSGVPRNSTSTLSLQELLSELTNATSVVVVGCSFDSKEWNYLKLENLLCIWKLVEPKAPHQQNQVYSFFVRENHRNNCQTYYASLQNSLLKPPIQTKTKNECEQVRLGNHYILSIYYYDILIHRIGIISHLHI